MLLGMLFGWLTGWLLKVFGLAPVLVAGAAQLGLQLNANELPSLGAFIGFVGGAFQTRFSFPAAGTWDRKAPAPREERH